MRSNRRRGFIAAFSRFLRLFARAPREARSVGELG